MRRLIAIGGGEIKNKTTLEIDRYVANLIKESAYPERGNALFIGTASHDSMPYFNSFRKTYTSVFDIKAEVALIVYGEMDINKIAEKIEKANCLYIGGGDTVYMLEKWKETGLLNLIISAYEKGKIICGLSAGAICWFNKMFTDYFIMRGQSSDYTVKDGLGIIQDTLCPHYNERKEEFLTSFIKNGFSHAYGVENNCAIEFIDEKINKVISAGGNAYEIVNENGTAKEIKL